MWLFLSITICFVGSMKPIFVLDHFKNRKFNNCHFFWLLNIYLTGRTQEKRILTNKMTFGTIYCYSLSFYAQTTCLENRNRKKCSSEILWNKKGNHEKHLCLIKKRKNSTRNAFGQRTKLNLFHTTAFKFWKAFRKLQSFRDLFRWVCLSVKWWTRQLILCY